MKLIRVFPRKTRATPDDSEAYCGLPFLWTEADKINISVTFTWDIPLAEKLEREWRHVGPTEIGGPAVGTKGQEFTPGLYLKNGYVITSRGCPNKCWFCSVPKRDGYLRELPIKEGWNVLDDNLLACSRSHIESVFDMLSRQQRKPSFTGGLESKRMEPWIAERLKQLKAESIFFAYDTPDDLEPLQLAAEMLFAAGFKHGSHVLRCYVLCGFPKDTIADATKRMLQTLKAGFVPMAMVWRNGIEEKNPLWGRFQRQYARPALTCKMHNFTQQLSGH